MFSDGYFSTLHICTTVIFVEVRRGFSVATELVPVRGFA